MDRCTVCGKQEGEHDEPHCFVSLRDQQHEQVLECLGQIHAALIDVVNLLRSAQSNQ